MTTELRGVHYKLTLEKKRYKLIIMNRKHNYELLRKREEF